MLKQDLRQAAIGDAITRMINIEAAGPEDVSEKVMLSLLVHLERLVSRCDHAQGKCGDNCRVSPH